MTGHSINTEQSQEFLSIMHTMIDDLDTISPNIDEHIYLRLVNGLQRLYNIHNTGRQTSTNVRETINHNTHNYRENVQDNNEVEITQILARHYGRVNDISGIPISNEPYPIISNGNPIISNANPIISNANITTNNEYRNIQSLNEETNRMNYSTRTRLILYGNVFNNYAN